MSVSNFLEDTLLNLTFNATAYAGQATVHVKLHIGDPGEAGTTNPAVHTTRAAVTFGAAASGVVTSDSTAAFTGMAANETITHVSLWDAAAAGNHLWNGPLTTPKPVTVGDNFSILSGQLTVSLD